MPEPAVPAPGVPAGAVPLWVPPERRAAGSHLGRWCREHGFASYDEAWEWSVAPATAGTFWSEVASNSKVNWRRPPDAALETDASR
ncbi:MAG: hypothetical protein ACRDZX_10530, partial [Acidimicrobiales bacterium]